MSTRALWAFVLCMGVFLLWFDLVMPVIFPRPKPPTGPPTAGSANDNRTTNDVVKPAPPLKRAPDFKEQLVTLANQRLSVTCSNKGASITDIVVRYPDGGESFQLLKRYKTRFSSMSISHLSAVEWSIEERKSPSNVVFKYSDENGISYEVSYMLSEDAYWLGVQYSIRNESDSDKFIIIPLNLFGGIEHDGDYYYDRFLHVLKGSRNGSYTVKELAPFDRTKIEGAAGLGVKNRYFALYAYPEGQQSAALFNTAEILPLDPEQLSESKMMKNCMITTSSAETSLKKGSSLLYGFKLYAGPISKAELAKVSDDITSIENFTGFDFISMVILAMLNFCYYITGNYGIAIILTTLLVRLILFPISAKSQVSMYKLQKLKPELDLLRAKYKDNQKKMAMEQMKIMKKHKIGYGSTCWGLLIQLPVFLGMFSVFETAVDLRHSEAFFWIGDLSQPDKLLEFGKSISLVVLTVKELNLLPIIMTITWIVQSALAPKSQDPNVRVQQKIFTFMPILFGLMCYNQASGLSLYFFVNSIMGIAEQYVIKKKLASLDSLLLHKV